MNLPRDRFGPRFTIRTLLTTMLIVGLILGWYSSLRRERERTVRVSRRLTYLEAELERSKSQAASWDRAATPGKSSNKNPDKRSVLWLAKLDGTNLRGVTLIGGVGAFCYTSFIDCNLQGASMTGDASSFQVSRFDGANLVDAKLTGGVSAFQSASFAHADLSGAVVTGGGSALQHATLEGANLTGAKLAMRRTAFQGVNIDSAKFQAADLSMLDADALESCYFDTPPSYDDKTKFPAGFDPVARQWMRVISDSNGHKN